MFVAPHVHPARLRVEVEDASGWHAVYEARSDEATWRRAFFDHFRMRSVTFRYAWPPFRKPYDAFAAWLADRAADDFPDATRVRVSYTKRRSPSPEEVRAGTRPEGRTILARTFELGPLREGVP
ncbi:MAG: hypothetical protein KC656_31660 [Myxococcales bacterium]|nr:hypothetical protein [Myxococcales bacterium]